MPLSQNTMEEKEAIVAHFVPISCLLFTRALVIFKRIIDHLATELHCSSCSKTRAYLQLRRVCMFVVVEHGFVKPRWLLLTVWVFNPPRGVLPPNLQDSFPALQGTCMAQLKCNKKLPCEGVGTQKIQADS